MVIFAIPEFGILFRCRAGGDPIDLEFGAFFALLKFVKDKLAKEQIAALQVMSSAPEFIFAFTGQSRHLESGSKRRRLLSEYTRGLQVAVGYVEPQHNAALWPVSQYASLPRGRLLSFGSDSEQQSRPAFKPFQKGIHL